MVRFGQVVTQWSEESTVESPAGEVYITSMRQGIGKDQALALTGTVEGKTLKVKGEGGAAGAGNTPWPAGVVGVAREPRLFKEVRQAGSEKLEYPTYIPTMNRVVKTTITFEGEESRVVWDKNPPRKVLRFHTKPEPIGKVKLPPSTTWVDAETFEPLLIETDFPALGRATHVSPDHKGGRDRPRDPSRRGLQGSIHRAGSQRLRQYTGGVPSSTR